MKNIIIIILAGILLSFNLNAATQKKGKNPFQIYLTKIEGLEAKYKKATKEKEKEKIQKLIGTAKEQLDKAVVKMKEPYKKKLEKCEKDLANTKTESKKEALTKFIEKTKIILEKIDALAKPGERNIEEQDKAK